MAECVRVKAHFLCHALVSILHGNSTLLSFYHFSESDFTFPTASRHRAEEILAEIKATYHMQLFSGVEHGFSTKGNPDDPNESMKHFLSLMSYIS